MLENFLLRPVEYKDFSSLKCLISKAKPGLTSLPKDSQILNKKIEQSIASFSMTVDAPINERYMFVLESIDTGSIVGTCSIISRVGELSPFYSFECSLIKYPKLHHYLSLYQVEHGPSEICMSSIF